MVFEELVEFFKKDYKKDPDFKDTPNRIQKMYEWFFRNEDAHIHATKVFPTNNDQMVIIKDLRAVSLCPHHFMPIEYNITIGYVPHKFALGLSKFSRIAKAVSSFPKLQENLTCEIAEIIESNLKPNGVMVVISGVHGCMKFRGVEEENSKTVTSDCRGVFRQIEARQEFLNLIK